MTDLTPDERAIASAAKVAAQNAGTSKTDAVWRAARAYQAEQDAKVCEAEMIVPIALYDDYSMGRNDCAGAIRERAKGLT